MRVSRFKNMPACCQICEFMQPTNPILQTNNQSSGQSSMHDMLTQPSVSKRMPFPLAGGNFRNLDESRFACFTCWLIANDQKIHPGNEPPTTGSQSFMYDMLITVNEQPARLVNESKTNDQPGQSDPGVSNDACA